MYGIVGYTGAILLIISAFREVPAGKSQSIVRAMYLTLSMIAVIILSGSGVEIVMLDSVGTNVIFNNNTGVVDFTETTTTTNKFILLNPIWILFHYMLAVVMLVYIILQILILFTKV